MRSGLIATVMLVVAALGLSAPPAGAYDPALLGQVEQIAESAWPDSPCAGRVDVEVTFQLENAHALGEAYENVGPGPVTDAHCLTRIRPDLDPVTLCLTMVHEYGHLAGHDHAEGGIMSATDAVGYGPCDQFGALPSTPVVVDPPRPTPLQMAEGLTERSCVLARGGSSERVYRCGRDHVLVTIDADGTISTELLPYEAKPSITRQGKRSRTTRTRSSSRHRTPA